MTTFKKNAQRSNEPKATYRVRNWAEYDRALVARGSVFLCFEDGQLAQAWRAEKNGRRGAQPTYTDTAIQTMLMVKAVFKLTNRGVEGFVKSLLARLGYDLQVR